MVHVSNNCVDRVGGMKAIVYIVDVHAQIDTFTALFSSSNSLQEI
jgi:hypothetical protein